MLTGFPARAQIGYWPGTR